MFKDQRDSTRLVAKKRMQWTYSKNDEKRCKAVRCMERPHALAILCNSIEAHTKWTLEAPKDESHVWRRGIGFLRPVTRRSDLRQAPSMISMSLHSYQILHEKLYDPMITVWIRYIVRPWDHLITQPGDCEDSVSALKTFVTKLT